MRYSIIAHDFGPYGGQEKIMADVAVSLSKDGHDVEVVTFRASEEVRNACAVRVVPRPRGPFVLRFLLFYILSPRYISPGRTVITCGAVTPRRAHITWMHFWHREHLIATHWFCAKNLSNKQFASQSVARFVALIAEYVSIPRNYTGILIAVSESSRRSLGKRYRKATIVCCENPVHVEKRMSQRTPFDPRDGKRAEILFVGGEWGRKGLRILAHAASQLALSRGEYIHMRIVGRGNASKLIRDLGNEFFSVTHIDWSDDVSSFMMSADLFVSASKYETFSLAGHEALGYGLPVLTTEVHGLADSVRATGCGLVTNRSVNAMRDGMADLLYSSPIGEDVRADAKSFVERRFSATSAKAQWVQALTSSGRNEAKHEI